MLGFTDVIQEDLEGEVDSSEKMSSARSTLRHNLIQTQSMHTARVLSMANDTDSNSRKVGLMALLQVSSESKKGGS
jgi:hypothetical protein